MQEKNRLYAEVASTLLCLVLLVSTTETSRAAGDKELLVLGDSLSAAYGIAIEEGWVSLLDKRLQDKNQGWYTRNVSISGSTTGNGLYMLNKALEQGRPDLILIELGANDGLRGFPLSLIERNLRSLIQTSKQSGAEVLLVAMELPTNYGAGYTSTFRAIYRQLAEEESVQLLPFLLLDIYDKPDLLQEDGLHPTAEAQPYILEILWPALEKAIAANS